MLLPPLLGSGLVPMVVFGFVGVTAFDADSVVGVTCIVTDACVVGGGWALALGKGSTVGGGWALALGKRSTVGGGAV
jgi:hypothetical protein